MLAASGRTCLKFCRCEQAFGLQFAAAFGFLSELGLVPALFAVRVRKDQSPCTSCCILISLLRAECARLVQPSAGFFGTEPPAGTARARSCRNYQNAFNCCFLTTGASRWQSRTLFLIYRQSDDKIILLILMQRIL